MALTRQQVVFTYASTYGSDTYRFDIVVDSTGQISVRNLQGPLGAISGLASLPMSVMNDVRDAMDVVTVQLADSEAVGGNVTFTGQTSITVAIPGGTLNNTNYRVAYTTPDGTALTTENETTTGFDVVAATAYGTALVPKVVAYSVVVATAQASTLSGTLTFAAADAGMKSVVFPAALTTATYRIVLTVGGNFGAWTLTRAKTGFTVQIGYALAAAETVTVGYDVFV